METKKNPFSAFNRVEKQLDALKTEDGRHQLVAYLRHGGELESEAQVEALKSKQTSGVLRLNGPLCPLAQMEALKTPQGRSILYYTIYTEMVLGANRHWLCPAAQQQALRTPEGRELLHRFAEENGDIDQSVHTLALESKEGREILSLYARKMGAKLSTRAANIAARSPEGRAVLNAFHRL